MIGIVKTNIKIVKYIQRVATFVMVGTFLFLPCSKAQTTRDLPARDFYVNEQGKIFAPLDKPVFLFLSRTPNSRDSLQPLGNKNDGGWMLESGKNTICNKVAYQEMCYEIWGDGNPPELEHKVSSDFQYHNDGILFLGINTKVQLIASDKLSGVAKTMYALNGGNFTEYTSEITQLPEGSVVIEYYAFDNVGNASDIMKVEFVIDNTAPISEMTLEEPVNDNIIGVGSSFSLLSQDNSAGVETIFYALNGDEPTIYSKPVQITGLDEQKTHTIQWYATDNTGNKEEIKSKQVIFDSTAPETAYNIENESFLNNDIYYLPGVTAVNLTANDTNGIEKIVYRYQNGSDSVYTQPLVLHDKAGMHFIRFSAIDKVENQSSEKVIKFYLDKTPPSAYHSFTQTVFWEGDTAILGPSAGLRLTATDLESGLLDVVYSINGGKKQNYDDIIDFEKDGIHKVTYWAHDNVKNESETQTLWIDFRPELIASDNSEPVAHPHEWVLNEKSELTGSTFHDFFIRISDSETEDGISYLLHIPDEEDTGVNQPLQFVKAGKNKILLDIAGTSASYNLQIDNNTPVTDHHFHYDKIHQESGRTFFNQGLKIALNSRDSQDGIVSGFESTWFAVNGSPYSPYSDSLDVFRSEGEYTLRYYAIDSVGNVEDTREVKFTIDLTAPKTSLDFNGPVYGNFLSYESSLVLTAQDNLSGVQDIFYSFDENGEEYKYSRPIGRSDFEKLGPGNHTLYFYAIDNVANTEVEKSYHFSLDLDKPVVNFISSGENVFEKGDMLFVKQNANLYLQASEPTTEISQLRYRINGGAYTDYEDKIKLPENDGRINLEIMASDLLGNRYSKNYRLFVDDSPPSSSISFEHPRFTQGDKLMISSKSKVIISSRDGGSGVQNIFYRIGRGAVRSYSEPIEIRGTGEHTIYYWATDNLGNKEESEQYTVGVDDTSPGLEIEFRHTSNGNMKEITSYTPVIIKANDNNGLSGVFYSINGGERNVYRQPLYQFEAGETIRLTAVAIDRVGNETVVTEEFTVK